MPSQPGAKKALGANVAQAATDARLWHPLCCQRSVLPRERGEEGPGIATAAGVASRSAGPGSDLSEALVLGVEPAALDFVAAPRCPPGPAAWRGLVGSGVRRVWSATSWR